MASFLFFHLAVALLLVLVHQQAEEIEDNFDLDKELEEYVNDFPRYPFSPSFGLITSTIRQTLNWWDKTMKREEVRDLYGDLDPLTVTVGDVEHSYKASFPRGPIIVHTQWINNGQRSESQNFTMKREIERKTTATWHVSTGFSYSNSIKASATVLDVTIENKHEIGIDLKYASINEVSDTEKFSITQFVTVPPRKSVKIDWVITDNVQERSWTSTVMLSGYIFASYSRSALYFLPVTTTVEAFNLSFLERKYPNSFTEIFDNMYEYICRGSYTAVNTQKSEINVTEYDYHAHGGRSSAIRTYTIPLSLTRHTPTSKTP